MTMWWTPLHSCNLLNATSTYLYTNKYFVSSIHAVNIIFLSVNITFSFPSMDHNKLKQWLGCSVKHVVVMNAKIKGKQHLTQIM